MKKFVDRVLQIIATLMIEIYFMDSIPVAARVNRWFGILMVIASIVLVLVNAVLVWRFIGFYTPKYIDSKD